MMDRDMSNLHHLKTPEDWAPEQINMRKCNGKNNSSGRGDTKALSSSARPCEMFESFRNLEDAMAMAKTESLKSDNVNGTNQSATLMQSFRNLDMALAQAQQNSLNKELDDCVNERSKTMGDIGSYNHNSPGSGNCNEVRESFRDLDEATALAIRNSLSDKGKNLFESFRNLDGAMNQAMDESLTPREEDGGMFESFANLDDAMAMAMKLSLNDAADEFDPYDDTDGKLGCLDEDYSEEEESEAEYEEWEQQTVQTVRGATDSMLTQKENHRNSIGQRPSQRELHHSIGSRMEYVAEPAPNLSRLARRHADRRIAAGRQNNSFTNGEERGGDDGDGRRTRRTGRRSSSFNAQTGGGGSAAAAASSDGGDGNEGGSRRARRSARRSSSFNAQTLIDDLNSSNRSGGDDDDESSDRRNTLGGNVDRRGSFRAMALARARNSGRNTSLTEGSSDDDINSSSHSNPNNPNLNKNSLNNSSTSQRRHQSETINVEDEMAHLHYIGGRRGSALIEEQAQDHMNPKERRKKNGSKMKNIFKARK